MHGRRSGRDGALGRRQLSRHIEHAAPGAARPNDGVASEALAAPDIGRDVRKQFAQVRASLLALVADLSRHDWDAVTAADPWRVRDVVAHLLGDDIGRLSRSRDEHAGPGPFPGEPLAAFLDRHNEQWVQATARASTGVLRELLTTTSQKIHEYWQGADLAALGEPVSWAGPGPAPVWLDCARDFTEDWVHQQQIREAINRTVASDPSLLHAVIDTFMHAMPMALGANAADASDGDTVTVRLDDVAGSWSWRRVQQHWRSASALTAGTTTIAGTADTWWRLCVRMLEPRQARTRLTFSGDADLADAATSILAIIR